MANAENNQKAAHLADYRWPKGIASPNPEGRGAGKKYKRAVSDRYAAQAEVELPRKVRIAMDLPEGSTWGDAWTVAASREALRPGTAGTLARKEIREAIEGKSAQRFEIMSQSERKIEILVNFKQAEVGNPAALRNRTLDIKPAEVAIDLGIDQIADGEFCPWPPKK